MNAMPDDVGKIEPLVIHVAEGGIVPVPVAAASPTPEAGPKPPPTTGEDGSFDLMRSLFTERFYTSDGNSFYTTDEVMRRAYELDFCRMNTQDFRIRAGITVIDKFGCELLVQHHEKADALEEMSTSRADVHAIISASPEMQQRMHHVLRRHRRLLASLYAFYSSVDGKLHSMTMRGYFAMMHRCNVVDSVVTNSELARIFSEADLEEKEDDKTLDDKMLNMINDDNALMRFEFLRAVTMVAACKYKNEKELDVAEQLDVLLTQVLSNYGPPAGRIDPDGFRRRRLYTEPTHAMLLRHQATLEQFFRVYSDETPRDMAMNDVTAGAYAAKPAFVSRDITQNEVFGETDLAFLAFPQANQRMNLDGFLGLLEDCGVLHSDDTPQTAGQIGMDEAGWAFIWSQDFVSDEVARGDALQQINFVSFMEALCRVTMFVRLPDKQSIAAYNVGSIEELFGKVMDGVFEEEALHPGVKVDWQVEEKSSEPMTTSSTS